MCSGGIIMERDERYIRLIRYFWQLEDRNQEIIQKIKKLSSIQSFAKTRRNILSQYQKILFNEKGPL